MISAFGLGSLTKAKVPFGQMRPVEQMTVRNAQQSRIRRKFARKYGPGEHDIAVGQLRRLSGSTRDFSNAEHHQRVTAIMPSMSERGMDNPVEVHRYKPMSGKKKHQVHADFHSGGHRLEAARRLGWKRVRTVVEDESSVNKSAFGIDHEINKASPKHVHADPDGSHIYQHRNMLHVVSEGNMNTGFTQHRMLSVTSFHPNSNAVIGQRVEQRPMGTSRVHPALAEVGQVVRREGSKPVRSAAKEVLRHHLGRF